MPQRLPPLDRMLDGLIAAPSVSSMIPAFDTSNRIVTERIADWAAGLGFRTDVHEVAPGKFNLVATLGDGDNGLVLAGHTDTVPWDDGGWRHDPLRATVVDGRVYGLGAADMKSFFAIALDAVRGLDAGRLRAPLHLVATADEESTMSGAQALAESGIGGAAHAVIGEPTGLQPIRAHKGIMMEALRVVGRPGHSSDPTFGANAIEGMHRVIGALLEWRDELQRLHREPAFDVPVPTMNLGHVHGGDNPNRICPSCDLQLDLRPLPGMAIDELRAELVYRARAALDGTPFSVESTALMGGVPPLATAADAPVVREAERVSGCSARTAAFATEGPYFAALGIDTVILGPGDIAQAHQPDEFLALDRIEPMQRILHALIRRFCLEPGR